MKKICLLLSVILGVCFFSGCDRAYTAEEIERLAEIDAMLVEPHKSGEITVRVAEGVTAEQIEQAFTELDLPDKLSDRTVFPFCSDRAVLTVQTVSGESGYTKFSRLWFSMTVGENAMRDTLLALSGCDLIEEAYPSVTYSEEWLQAYLDDWDTFDSDEAAPPENYGIPEIDLLRADADELLQRGPKDGTLILLLVEGEDPADAWELLERLQFPNDFCDTASFPALTYTDSGRLLIRMAVPQERLRESYILLSGMFMEGPGYPVYFDFET